MKVRRYYTDENETHNARNIEQIAEEKQPRFTKQGGFCRACNRWSVTLTTEKRQCKHCEKRAKELG
jgi:hypothetical protein